jgi:hypothetical protein
LTQPAPTQAPLDPTPLCAALDRLDHTAHEHERRWGIGRLRLLVDDLLRARFDRQAKLLDDALAYYGANSETVILSHVDAMCRGWVALDQAARAAGHVPKPPAWLEAVGPDGRLFVLVDDNADASVVTRHVGDRQAVVFTAAEVANLLTAWPDIATVKQTFEGARVTAIRVKRPVDWANGEDIPW